LLPDWASSGADRNAVWQGTTANEAINKEIGGLIVAARDERSDALDEIVAQHDEFASYFLNLLSASNGYPATAKLLTITSFIAGFCGMYYKGKYQRPRPTMLCPSLLPPLAVPGHASFPSGHSTQAHLMALCLVEALSRPVKDADPISYTPPPASTVRALTTLADRIARNRELAGLHYPSDSTAGKLLAPLIMDRLKQEPNVLFNGKAKRLKLLEVREGKTWYQLALENARSEWK
jgi:hypothetical protein